MGKLISVRSWVLIDLCAFCFHHPSEAIFYRHEYDRKPIEILHSQARSGQGSHIDPGGEFVP